MADILEDLMESYERIRRNAPPRQVYIDSRVPKETAVALLRDTGITAHFPDGSAYLRGEMVKGPVAWSASPETLSHLNARIATMSLPPRRLQPRPYDVYALGEWGAKKGD